LIKEISKKENKHLGFFLVIPDCWFYISLETPYF